VKSRVAISAAARRSAAINHVCQPWSRIQSMTQT
jgi:hypothetical protein